MVILRQAEKALLLQVWSQSRPVVRLRQADFCPALEVRLKGLIMWADQLTFHRQSSPVVRVAIPMVLNVTSHLKVQAREELRQPRKILEMTIS